MISDRNVAAEVSKCLLEANRLLNQAVAVANAGSSMEEFSAFRLAIGKVLGELLVEVVNPLYRQHPDLKPPELFVPGI